LESNSKEGTFMMKIHIKIKELKVAKIDPKKTFILFILLSNFFYRKINNTQFKEFSQPSNINFLKEALKN